MEEQNRGSVTTCIAPPASDVAAGETSSTTAGNVVAEETSATQHRVSLCLLNELITKS